MNVVDEHPYGGACFDVTRRYRYRLWRVWNPDLPTVCFVMLNPSTADADKNDPTIRRCIGFAQAWSFGRLDVVNLFALRSPRPSMLTRAAAPVGPDNDKWITAVTSAAATVIVAWGANPNAAGRHSIMHAVAKTTVLHCLGVTQSGQPRHPLFVPATKLYQPWTPKER